MFQLGPLEHARKYFLPFIELMAALVTCDGLIPLALGVEEPGKEIQQPMAVVILGGIVTSTFLNMIVIPALYSKYGRAEAPAAARA